jgi:hypothetical protein
MLRGGHEHLFLSILLLSFIKWVLRREQKSAEAEFLSKSDLKLVCNVNIVYGNLKSEDSRDYARKPQ